MAPVNFIQQAEVVTNEFFKITDFVTNNNGNILQDLAKLVFTAELRYNVKYQLLF